eukprot:1622736-Amphidinium_carterae.1
MVLKGAYPQGQGKLVLCLRPYVLTPSWFFYSTEYSAPMTAAQRSTVSTLQPLIKSLFLLHPPLVYNYSDLVKCFTTLATPKAKDWGMEKDDIKEFAE